MEKEIPKTMVSIIVPAYNEEQAVPKVIHSIKTVMSQSNISAFEILIVDDCSSDGTLEAANKTGVKVIKNLNNVGYGFSLKQGIKAASYDTILIMDCDETYPTEKIPELIKKYNEGFSLVIGQRTGKYYNPSFKKLFLRKILEALIFYTSGKKSLDVNSGMRVFSKTEIIPFFSFCSNTFSFTSSQTLIYILCCKFIYYIPISYSKRTGETKLKTRDVFRTFQQIVEIITLFNPIKIYLLLIVPSLLVCFSFLILYIVCGYTLLLLGALSFFLTGIILIASALLSLRNKFTTTLEKF